MRRDRPGIEQVRDALQAAATRRAEAEKARAAAMRDLAAALEAGRRLGVPLRTLMAWGEVARQTVYDLTARDKTEPSGRRPPGGTILTSGRPSERHETGRQGRV